MAVSGTQQPDLAPSYQQVIGQLQNSANLELKRPTLAGTASGAIDKTVDFAQDLGKIYLQHSLNMQAQKDRQAFESRGDMIMTQDMYDQVKSAFGVEPPYPVGSHVPGSSIKEFQANAAGLAERMKQKDFETALDEYTKNPDAKDAKAKLLKAVVGSGKEDSPIAKTLADSIFGVKAKQIPIYDETSPTKYYWGVIDSNGVIQKTGQVAPPPAGSEKGGKALGSTELDKLNVYRDLSTKVQQAMDNYDPNFIGPVDAAKQALLQRTPLASEKAANFIQGVQGLTNTEMKRLYGTRLTKAEISRYGIEGPVMYRNEKDFKARMKKVAEMLNTDITARLATLKNTGYNGVPDIPLVAPPPEFGSQREATPTGQAPLSPEDEAAAYLNRQK